MSNFYQRSGTGRLHQNPSTIQNSDLDITATNIPVAVRDDPTYGTYRRYADGTTQGRVLTSSLLRSAATALVTNTAKTIVSRTVPVGVWMVSAMVGVTRAGATVQSSVSAAVSLTTNTLPGNDTLAVPSASGEVMAIEQRGATGGDEQLTLPSYRLVVTTEITLYLVVQATFTISTESAYGWIQAVSIL